MRRSGVRLPSAPPVFARNNGHSDGGASILRVGGCAIERMSQDEPTDGQAGPEESKAAPESSQAGGQRPRNPRRRHRGGRGRGGGGRRPQSSTPAEAQSRPP